MKPHLGFLSSKFNPALSFGAKPPTEKAAPIEPDQALFEPSHVD